MIQKNIYLKGIEGWGENWYNIEIACIPYTLLTVNQMLTCSRGTPISRLQFEFLFPNSTEITNENIFKGWKTGKTECRWGCMEGSSYQCQPAHNSSQQWKSTCKSRSTRSPAELMKTPKLWEAGNWKDLCAGQEAQRLQHLLSVSLAPLSLNKEGTGEWFGHTKGGMHQSQKTWRKNWLGPAEDSREQFSTPHSKRPKNAASTGACLLSG